MLGRQQRTSLRVRGQVSTLIGLGGKYRAGKDVVADHLVDSHGFRKIGMSDILAEALYALNPVVVLDESGQYVRYQELHDVVGYVAAKEMSSEVRRLLQVLGTEVGRQLLGEDVWVEAIGQRIKSSSEPVVVTGIRFFNELDMIRQLGGVSVFIIRPGLQQEATTAQHASETTLEEHNFNLVVLNTGSIEDLQEAAEAVLRAEGVLSA